MPRNDHGTLHRHGRTERGNQEFEATLLGWWWTVGHCLLTRHASCGPDRQGKDKRLLELPIFDEGFHCDDPEGTLASSLRNVMAQALAAKRRLPERPP